MRVEEVFYSIQGEGRWLGMPVIFIRTQGCSLHCPFCDQKTSWKSDDAGQEYDKMQLVQLCKALKPTCDTVVITGGEPTEQPDLYEVTEWLKSERYNVHLETNGTSDILRGYFSWVVCSPKAGAGYRIASGADELKYVIGEGDDINAIIPAHIREMYKGRIWLQPKADGNDVLLSSVEWCKKIVLKDPRLRMGVQLHKLINVR